MWRAQLFLRVDRYFQMHFRVVALLLCAVAVACADPARYVPPPDAALIDAPTTGGSAGSSGGTGGGVDATAGSGGGGAGVSDAPQTEMDGPPAMTTPDAGCDPGSGTPKLCGTRCGACCGNEHCPAMAGRDASCDQATLTCRYACPTGSSDCNGKCIAAAACCTDAACPMMSGQVGRCDTSTNQCSYACAPNTIPCGTRCIPQGGCCSDTQCTGNRACVNDTCSTTQCRSGYTACGDRCIANGQCCTDEPCMNNCGQMGRRACISGSLGNCSQPQRTCCQGDTQPCSNRCGQSGTRTCSSSGNWGACSVTDVSCCTPSTETCNGRDDDCDGDVDECPSGQRCEGGRCQQPCGVRGGPCCTGARKCSSTSDFCCDIDGFCTSSELNTCITRRGSNEFCDYTWDDGNDWCRDELWCSGDDDRCHPQVGEGATCGGKGSPECQSGLFCDGNTNVCRRW